MSSSGRSFSDNLPDNKNVTSTNIQYLVMDYSFLMNYYRHLYDDQVMLINEDLNYVLVLGLNSMYYVFTLFCNFQVENDVHCIAYKQICMHYIYSLL